MTLFLLRHYAQNTVQCACWLFIIPAEGDCMVAHFYAPDYTYGIAFQFERRLAPWMFLISSYNIIISSEYLKVALTSAAIRAPCLISIYVCCTGVSARYIYMHAIYSIHVSYPRATFTQGRMPFSFNEKLYHIPSSSVVQLNSDV